MAPLVQYFQRLWCAECVCTHWVEVLRNGREICHGEAFQPKNSPTQYTRHAGRGVEVIQTDASPAQDSYLEERYEAKWEN